MGGGRNRLTPADEGDLPLGDQMVDEIAHLFDGD